MKKKLATLFIGIALVGTLGAVAGCSTDTQTASGAMKDGALGAPALQPADHEGRFERGGANKCYGCHGSGSLANPQLTGSPMIPEDHYADSSYDTKQLEPNRDQCLTCHPVGD